MSLVGPRPHVPGMLATGCSTKSSSPTISSATICAPASRASRKYAAFAAARSPGLRDRTARLRLALHRSVVILGSISGSSCGRSSGSSWPAPAISVRSKKRINFGTKRRHARLRHAFEQLAANKSPSLWVRWRLLQSPRLVESADAAQDHRAARRRHRRRRSESGLYTRRLARLSPRSMPSSPRTRSRTSCGEPRPARSLSIRPPCPMMTARRSCGYPAPTGI